MPANFLEAKTEILQYAKRPITDADWNAIAGGIINESLMKLQRIIPDMNALGKVASGLIYTGGSETISFSDVAEGTDINKVMALHITSGNDWVGEPIRLYTYKEFTDMMQAYEDNDVQNYIEDESSNSRSFNRYISNNFGRIAFVLGTDIGLYPLPTEDVTISLHYTPWLSALVEDTDSNILLTYCWEFLLYSSLIRLNLLLSEGDRISVSSELLNFALSEAKNWNRSLAYSNPIEM
jgi:hypothetical protein